MYQNALYRLWAFVHQKNEHFYKPVQYDYIIYNCGTSVMSYSTMKCMAIKINTLNIGQQALDELTEKNSDIRHQTASMQ
jgi:hypothetical protein